MPEIHFDEEIAASYDDDSDERFDPGLLASTTGFLAELAGGGRALELAIGTGRVAVPLAAARGAGVGDRALAVHARAPAGQARRRRHRGGEGDMTTTRVDGEFALVYLVYNTITNLTSQDEQVACFENAARHLAPGGCFVVEVFVPILRMLPPGTTRHVFADEPGYHAYDVYDFANADRVVSPPPAARRRDLPTLCGALPLRVARRVRPDGAGSRGCGCVSAGPTGSESPFTGESEQHVSVWEKP